MTTENCIDLKETDEGFFIARNRQELVLTAALEIEKLSQVLRSHEPRQPDLVVRGISVRIQDLGEAIASAVNEPACPTSQIRFDILGKPHPAEKEEHPHKIDVSLLAGS